MRAPRTDAGAQPTALAAPASCTSDAAAPARAPARAPRGRVSRAALASASASSGGRRERGGGEGAGPRGLAASRGRSGGGRAPSARHQSGASTPEVATAPSMPEHGGRAAVSGWRTCDVVGAADAHVAAAVDRARRREQRGGAVGDEALAAAAEVEPEAGRALDRPAASSTRISRQRAAGSGAAGRRGGAARERAAAGGRDAARASRSPRARARRAASGRRARRSARRRERGARPRRSRSAEAGTTGAGRR